MVIADHMEDQAPQDPFKIVHVKQKSKDLHFSEKPNAVRVQKPTEEAEFTPVQDLVEREDQQEQKYQQNHRWTTYEMQFTRGEKKVKRCFDKLPQAKLRPGDVNPIYSSFHPGGIFR
jgi:hypothetical protein